MPLEKFRSKQHHLFGKRRRFLYSSLNFETGSFMISKQQALTALQQFKKEVGSEYGIVSLGIFGSLARNQANEGSDIDVIVETKKVDAFQIIHIKEELEELLNSHVDIVRKRERMNPFLKKRIERDVVYV